MENIIYRRVLPLKEQQELDKYMVGGVACAEVNGYSVWVLIGHPDGFESRLDCFVEGSRAEARELAIEAAVAHYKTAVHNRKYLNRPTK